LLVRITVNGQSMDVAEGTSVDALLRELAVARQFTAVAVNREITPKSAYVTTTLSAGDRVEIVKPMGGG
jgi:sulfur carrier protein